MSDSAIRIALQLYTVRERAGNNFLGTLREVADVGYRAVELAGFHDVPVADLRAALDQANVELWALLIDDGDVTHPEHHDRDAAWIAGWLDVAGALGATCARVIAGKQPPSNEAFARSRAHLADLTARAKDLNVRLMTENWFGFLPSPPHVHALLDALGGELGLCVDFGNWDDRRTLGGDATKYGALAAIFPRGTSCHAKCEFAASGEPDLVDYTRCLDLGRAAGYAGPFTLVAAGPGDAWDGLALQREVLLRYAA